MTTKTEDTTEEETPVRIFITPVADSVAGQWYDIETIHDVEAAIEEQHDEYGDVDIFAADWEGIPRSIMNQWIPEDEIAGYLQLLDDHEKEIADAYVEHFADRCPPEEWSEDLRNRHAGTYDDMKSYAWEIVDRRDTGDLPETWIDIEAVVQSIEHDCYEHVVELSGGFGRVAVFLEEY